MSAVTYPVRVDATLDRHLSRWLWLVKWVLAIPHYIVLSFLWLAFAVLSVAAFFAILFTGRYPRSIFEFNVGVIRWTWRVEYYAYGALGTDRYPPFSLDEVPGYPAHLEIEYPERLSRGLVLIKWWLLALPQYIIVGLFAGGGAFAAWRADTAFEWARVNLNWLGGGLIGILVLIAAVILLFTGRYPDPIFDFVLGLNRWVLRVAAYAGLMTDKYPPFRLDIGGHEPEGTLRFAPAAPATGLAPADRPPGADSALEAPSQPPGPASRPGWTPARIVAVVIGAVLTLSAIGLVSGGAALLWAGSAHRQNGYITTPSQSYSTSGYALATETMQLPGEWQWFGDSVVGKVRISVTAADRTKPVFVGIAPANAVTGYLSGVSYATLTNIGGHSSVIEHAGSAVPANPSSAAIWTRQVTGTGTQRLTWTPRAGNWMVVAMNADASPSVHVNANVGATLPAFGWIVGGLLAGGLILAIAGLLLIVIPVRRAG